MHRYLPHYPKDRRQPACQRKRTGLRLAPQNATGPAVFPFSAVPIYLLQRAATASSAFRHRTILDGTNPHRPRPFAHYHPCCIRPLPQILFAVVAVRTPPSRRIALKPATRPHRERDTQDVPDILSDDLPHSELYIRTYPTICDTYPRFHPCPNPATKEQRPSPYESTHNEFRPPCLFKDKTRSRHKTRKNVRPLPSRSFVYRCLTECQKIPYLSANAAGHNTKK